MSYPSCASETGAHDHPADDGGLGLRLERSTCVACDAAAGRAGAGEAGEERVTIVEARHVCFFCGCAAATAAAAAAAPRERFEAAAAAAPRERFERWLLRGDTSPLFAACCGVLDATLRWDEEGGGGRSGRA